MPTPRNRSSVAAPRVSERKRFLRILFQRKLVMFGVVVLVILVLVAIFAPLIAPHDPYLNDMSKSLQTAERGALLGTDNLGRDTFSRLVYGAQNGADRRLRHGRRGGDRRDDPRAAGRLSGRGRPTASSCAIMDALMGFPMLVLALLLAAVLGGGIQNVIIALAIATLPGYARLMCGETLSVKENEYIMAQRAIGAKSLRTMVRHILPNAFQPTLVLITTMLGNVILAEAGPQLPRHRHQAARSGVGQHGRRRVPVPRDLTPCSPSPRPSPSWWWCSPSTWWATACGTLSTRS